MYRTIVLLFATYIITVHSQTWNGTFTVNSVCDTTSCCCLSNSLVLTCPSANMLEFDLTLSGQCYQQTSYSTQISYPSGYTYQMSVYGVITLMITLSSDSNTITVNNPSSPSCGVTAARQEIVVGTTTVGGMTTSVHSIAARQHINMIILCSLVLLVYCNKD